ncbi:hypothetical protein BMW24_018295 [Mycobacterium heckeshornense]|uniref:Uncharacterized protein n=1 Tax=Mycobacterium heckeshornense TaxID=110505 RepID=A0A2G8B4A9_9MYCO|nr:hypothetical protein [Mycobacterium heckeshornense]MCV7034192.1 hypothetical protein [Mycobacterium heckeshornense]PIJ32602.1 hypothetical protein BMW24_018295 [Mycobacterium heckeshornense]BCO36851.1 hypothetical protein MHEC_32840 [Mycobacterium heckeshornense]
MTEPGELAENPGTEPESAENPGTEPGENENSADDNGQAPANREAAKYRTRLRAVEAERDTLAARLAAYQRRECEQVVADILDQPADLFEIGGVQPGDFYTEDGNLDRERLVLCATALADRRPRLAKPRPARRNWGQYSTVASSGITWSDIIAHR